MLGDVLRFGAASEFVEANRALDVAMGNSYEQGAATALTMLKLTAYFDETGHPSDPKAAYFGIAGFVAAVKNWRTFEMRWNSILRFAAVVAPFHMKDFAHFRGQFEKFREREEERRVLFGKLIAAIVETKATPVATIVSLADFRTLTKAQQTWFRNPYYFCFQDCVRGAAVEAIFEDPKEKVNMVFTKHPEYKDGQSLWMAMKRSWEHRSRMGSFAISTPERRPQLQAADVFAYELFHEFDNRLKRADAPMRWGIRQFVGMQAIPLPRIRLFDRKELLRIIKEGNFQDQTGTEEVENRQMLSAMEQMIRWRVTRAG